MLQTQNSMTCEVCGAHVNQLRRGRCWICYIRWAESRPVGFGASCVICNDRRRDNLRLVEFHGAWIPMCHNCGTRALRLSPMPGSLEGLRQRLNRDRRWNDRRRELPDPRDERNERRQDERRAILLTPDQIIHRPQDPTMDLPEATNAPASGDLTRITPT